MYTHKQCTTQPDLYINWAWELEQAENFKKAEHVFAKGMDKVEDEEAKAKIKRKRELFQVKITFKSYKFSDTQDTSTPIGRGIVGQLINTNF